MVETMYVHALAIWIEALDLPDAACIPSVNFVFQREECCAYIEIDSVPSQTPSAQVSLENKSLYVVVHGLPIPVIG